MKIYPSTGALSGGITAQITTETGTSRTLAAGDNGTVIYCTNGSAVTITCATGLPWASTSPSFRAALVKSPWRLGPQR